MSTRILVVDDNDELQAVIKRVFELEGFEVVQAFGGAEALRLAASEVFSLILLDINMPGMDGRDVLSSLKRGGPSSGVPVLVHSSRNAQLDRHAVLQLGADDYIDKPMDARFLARRIGRMLDMRKRTGETKRERPDE
ncbi:MAG TPA: response regulator [Polyangiaceae bacterium]|jgi:DNA-binding response OmpR family regulator|nr:response regulator [Polyangiaceae bacterium]